MNESDLCGLAKPNFIFDVGLSKENLNLNIQPDGGNPGCYASEACGDLPECL